MKNLFMNRCPVIMAIKPKFAKLIYEGRKFWEFRTTNPPPLMRLVYVYEPGREYEITGTIMFRMKIEGILDDVWEKVTMSTASTFNGTGIRYSDLRKYVGDSKTVAALRVCDVKRMDTPLKVKTFIRPPRNWCSLTAAISSGFCVYNVEGGNAL